MQSRTATTVIALWLFACSLAFAETKKPFADSLYKNHENRIREDLGRSFELAKLERERKIKAGEPPISPQIERDGSDGIRLVLYNKAVIYATCADEAANASKMEGEVLTAATACMNSKSTEMLKFTKLMEYSDSIGARKLTACEMKARDYKNELRFPPYEFLRTSSGPKLFDFKMLNDCILADAN